MFGDYSWISKRSAIQEENFDDFLKHNNNHQMVVIEMGAGSAIPTIRHLSEQLGQSQQVRIIRINPREPQIKAPHFSFSGGSVEILSQIQEAMN
jgi:hypothetical protein